MEHIGYHLKNIYFNKLKGQLVFRKNQVQKFLFFQDGYLIHARTNQPGEMLGEVLYRTDKISESTHSNLDALIEPKKSIGEVLIEKDLISRDDLKEGLKIHMQEILLNTFPVFDAEIKFEPKGEFIGKTFDVKILIPSLIETGIRRMKYRDELKELMKGKSFAPKSKEFFFRLSEEEKEIYKKITVGDDPEAALKAMNIRSENFWKGLYLLSCLNLIEPEEDFKEKKAESEEETHSDERLREVLNMYSRIEEINYYKALDISKDATTAEVKKAYFTAARKYHPDLFDRSLSREARDKIDDVFDFITKAYHTLKDESARRKYESKEVKKAPAEKEDSKKQGEVKFRKGKTLYDQSRYKDALLFLQEAVRLDPNQSKYFLLLALAQSKLDMYHRQAEKNFLKAIDLSPWNPESYVGLGMMYRKEELKVKARKQFKKALSLDPDHKAARSQLADLEGKSKKKSLKDLLSMDLFSKKEK